MVLCISLGAIPGFAVHNLTPHHLSAKFHWAWTLEAFAVAVWPGVADSNQLNLQNNRSMVAGVSACMHTGVRCLGGMCMFDHCSIGCGGIWVACWGGVARSVRAPCILLGIFITQIDIECMELGYPLYLGGPGSSVSHRPSYPLNPSPQGPWDLWQASKQNMKIPRMPTRAAGCRNRDPR